MMSDAMENSVRPDDVRICRSCGAALNSLTVCQSCGAILPVERVANDLKRTASSLALRVVGRLGENNLYLWGLALAPIVMAPPLLALWKLWDARRTGRRIEDESFLVIASVLNIVLSIFFWRWLAHAMADVAPGLMQPFRPPASPSPILKI